MSAGCSCKNNAHIRCCSVFSAYYWKIWDEPLIFFFLWDFCNVSLFLVVFDDLIIGWSNLRVLGPFRCCDFSYILHSRQRQLVVIVKIWFAASPWDLVCCVAIGLSMDLLTPFFHLFYSFCVVKAFSSSKVNIWLVDVVITIDLSSQRLLQWQTIDWLFAVDMTGTIRKSKEKPGFAMKIFHHCRSKTNPFKVGQSCYAVIIWLISANFLQQMVENGEVTPHQQVDLLLFSYTLHRNWT